MREASKRSPIPDHLPLGAQLIEAARRSDEVDALLRSALVALWTDRRSDKHAELYAEAMAALNEWVVQEC